MSSWFNPKTEKRTSPIQGRGLFARVAIQAGEVVAVKGGAIMDFTALDHVRDHPGRSGRWRVDHRLRDDRRRSLRPHGLFVRRKRVPQGYHGRRLAPSAPSASLRWLLLALHRGPVQWLRRITYGSSRP